MAKLYIRYNPNFDAYSLNKTSQFFRTPSDQTVPVITNCWVWGSATPFNWGDNISIEPNEWGEACTPQLSVVGGGAPLIGNTLQTTNGVWYSDTGVTAYEYQWYRGVTPIGTNSNTYILVVADAGQNITCQVRAQDSDGWSAWVTSNIILAIP